MEENNIEAQEPQVEQQDTTTVESTPQTQEGSFTFISDEEVAQAQQPIVQEETQEPQQENVNEIQPDQPVSQDQYSQEELEGAVFNYLSERLGREVKSIDDFQTQQTEQKALDERISVISDFVEKTGRDPRDWFVYQSMNPSEMDDMTAIQVKMASDYPNLSQQEIQVLVSSKYKLDPDLNTEQEVTLSKLQMKLDSEEARKGIESLRSEYQAPVTQGNDNSSIIDDNWISGMKSELDAMEGIEFNLGNDKKFTFGLTSEYKNQLADKNARLDEFFDPYINDDGVWDYDMLNMHRAVIDNVESIVSNVYSQGLSDGQRGVVEKAANVSPTSPNQPSQPNGDNLAQQLRQILRPNGGMF